MKKITSITQLIEDLEKIREEHGNLECCHDRFSGGLSAASVVFGYKKILISKREVSKFWSEYSDNQDSKGDKVVIVW